MFKQIDFSARKELEVNNYDYSTPLHKFRKFFYEVLPKQPEWVSSGWPELNDESTASDISYQQNRQVNSTHGIPLAKTKLSVHYAPLNTPFTYQHASLKRYIESSGNIHSHQDLPWQQKEIIKEKAYKSITAKIKKDCRTLCPKTNRLHSKANRQLKA